MNELEIKEKLAREEFRLSSLAEVENKSKEIAEEIKAILRKHGVPLPNGITTCISFHQVSKSIPCGIIPAVSNLT